MNWPYVSRETLRATERALAIAEGQVDYLRGALERAHQQSNDLLSQVLTLKREGFGSVPVLPTLPLQPQLPMVVLAAIGEKAPRGTPLYRQLLDAAWALHQAQVPDAEIVVRIQSGESVDL